MADRPTDAVSLMPQTPLRGVSGGTARPAVRTGPAIGLIETVGIARGMVVCDSMVKRSPVDILEATTVTPGKYVILVAGEVAEVDEAMGAGLEVAAEQLLDRLFLPNPHARLIPAIRGEAARAADLPGGEIGAVGIIELATIASAIVSADAAAKAADVALLELRLATGIGGKAYFTLTGELHEIQAAVEAAVGRLEAGRLVNREIIARPHEDFARRIPLSR